MSDAGHALYQAAWVFYAFGPQFVICLALGYAAARRSGGGLLTWLVIGFLSAVVPVAGVIVMAALYWRTRSSARHPAATPEGRPTPSPVASDSPPAQPAVDTATAEAGDAEAALAADTPPCPDASAAASPVQQNTQAADPTVS